MTTEFKIGEVFRFNGHSARVKLVFENVFGARRLRPRDVVPAGRQRRVYRCTEKARRDEEERRYHQNAARVTQRKPSQPREDRRIPQSQVTCSSTGRLHGQFLDCLVCRFHLG